MKTQFRILLSTLTVIGLLGNLTSCKKNEDEPYVAPTISTVAATDITTDAATVGVAVSTVGSGKVSDYGLVVATKDNPTLSDTKFSLGSSLSATTSQTVKLTGLTPGTTYYARAYVRNDRDTYYGNSVNFSTGALKTGVVATGTAASVVTTSFEIAGNLSDIGTGGVTNVGHVLSATNQTPTLADTKTELGAATAPKTFTSSFASLSVNTTYYVRAYVTNGAGTAYGQVVTVKTLNLEAATVRTGNPSDILSTAAKASGTIDKAGSAQITSYGHCWSSTNQVPTVGDAKTTLTAAGNFPLNFSSDLTGLVSNTTYYIRAYATSAAGTAYSGAVTFKTSDASDALNSFTSLKLTLTRGDDYSGADQPSLINLTTGQVYKFGDGAANAANVDLIVKLFATTKVTTGDDVQIYSPAKALDDNKFWGDFVTKLIAQNWSVYKATKINYLSETNYPMATWWAKINTATDLAAVIKNSFVSLNSTYYNIMESDGTVYNGRIFVFQTKEGKQGILRITEGSKKADSYTVTLDIKVQK